MSCNFDFLETSRIPYCIFILYDIPFPRILWLPPWSYENMKRMIFFKKKIEFDESSQGFYLRYDSYDWESWFFTINMNTIIFFKGWFWLENINFKILRHNLWIMICFKRYALVILWYDLHDRDLWAFEISMIYELLG